MKKSELRHIVRKIIQEQLSTGTEVYSPEGCEKIDLYSYIMDSGNYPTYDGTTGSYPNFTNDQVVLTWCGRCSAAQNKNGSYSFVMQTQPPQDEPNCKCCPQFENIDWPGEPEEPDTDIPFRDPNKDVPFEPPKPPRPDFPFKDPDKDVPFEPPIPPRPERPITPITLGDDGGDSDDGKDIFSFGAFYCAGDYDPTLNEIDPSATSDDCVFIANYDNPQQLQPYDTLEQCIAASSCTGPTSTDDGGYEWTNLQDEPIDCSEMENVMTGYYNTESMFCYKCFQDVMIQSEDGSYYSASWEQLYNQYNNTNLAYCTCCDGWGPQGGIGTGNFGQPLEESVKTRLQKLANIQKK